MLLSLAITLWFLGSLDPFYVMPNALLGGLLGGLLSGGGAAQPPQTHSRKTRHLSWQPFLQRLVIGSLIGLAIGLSYGRIFGRSFGLGAILTTAALVLEERGAREGHAPAFPLLHIRLEMCSYLL